MNLQIKTANFIFTFCSCLLALNHQIIGLHSFITSNLPRDEYQIRNCPTSKFQCKNGQCIAESFLCDGIADCKDSSDETDDHCQNSSCDEESFQCDYGACIKKEYQCDGLKQCVDGSDEWLTACNGTDDELGRSKRAAGNSCPVPNPSADKTITYLCDGKESESCGTEGGFVPEYTVALMQCKQNYQPREESQNRFICHSKTWIPPIDKCYKICNKLSPVNVDFQCFYKGVSISCDDGDLIAGTKIRPACKPLHKYADGTPDYLEITCRDDGTWDKTLFKCTPECGRQYAKSTPLLQGGVEEKVGNSPWHVAIYNREKVLICGGTLISPNLVVSAAHCFREQVTNSKKNATDFEVVVGKFHREYSEVDDNQQIFKVKEIRETNKGYSGRNSYFTGDIAVLILQDKITISPAVLPACVDWIGLRNRDNPPEGSLAKVSGWGMDQTGKYSETLKTAQLPYISRERCINTVPEDFKAYVTFDKFCAGSETGIGVLQGDSGGGLLFQKDNFYYLRGVVSTKHATSTAIATFTDLADHIEWVIGMRNEIEQQEANNKPNLNTLLREANTAITSKIRDLPKLLELSELLQKEINDQETIANNLKSQAQSVYETLKNSMQTSAIDTYTDAFVNDRLQTVSKFGADLAKTCYECFQQIIDKVVDNVASKLTSKKLLATVRRPQTFTTVLERIPVSAAIFNKLKQNGDMNSDSSIQLANYIKETMEMPSYERAQSNAKSLMKHIQYNLPKSVKNLVFSSKICIRNVEYNEYLYASNAPGDYNEIMNGGAPTRRINPDTDRRQVYTWKGSLIDTKEAEAFAWKLKPYRDGYEILNAKYGDRMYSGVPRWDVERRYVFTWRKIEDGSFPEGTWQFEPDGDNVYIKNTHQNEYLFADFDRIRDGNKRYAFTFIPRRKPQLDSKWMVVACPNQ